MSLYIDQNLSSTMEILLSPKTSVTNALKLKRFQPKGFSMFYKALVLLMCLSASSLALAAKTGAGSGGGGDFCENRIQEIRDDISSWIKKTSLTGYSQMNKSRIFI